MSWTSCYFLVQIYGWNSGEVNFQERKCAELRFGILEPLRPSVTLWGSSEHFDSGRIIVDLEVIFHLVSKIGSRMTENSGLIVKNITVLPWKQKALLSKQKISDFDCHFFHHFSLWNFQESQSL